MTNFSSITGISLSSAEAGEVVKISYRLNCKDDIQLNKSIISRNMLDDLVYPEIMKRVSTGTISTNVKLRKVHIMMFSDEAKNKISLNGRTRFVVQIKPKAGLEVKQKIRENDVEEILGIYPSKQNDPNAAHIMMFKFKGDWLISYDFTYNIRKARENVEIAKEEIKDSEQALEKKEPKLFVRKQYKAAKLGVQSVLVLNNSRLSFKTSTNILSGLFSEYIRNGNLDSKFSDYFDKVTDLKVKNENSLNEYFKKGSMIDILHLTKELIEHAELKLDTTESYRSPPPGIYSKPQETQQQMVTFLRLCPSE